MLKPFLALLLVVAALSGGIYAFHGSKGSKRPKKDDASLLLRRYQQYFSAPSPATPASPAPGFLIVWPRVAAVVAAALVFGSAAYFGLGQTIQANAIPTTTASVASKSVVLDDAQLQSESQLLNLLVSTQLVPPAAPVVAEAAPPPGPLAEEPAPAPPPPEPAPAPEPEPVVEAYVPASFPEGTFEAIICSMPWPCGEAISVASCESGTDRNGNLDGNWATNGNHFGLYQISYIHAWRWADFYDAWMDPARNVQYAYEIWSESGWRPWSCRPY